MAEEEPRSVMRRSIQLDRELLKELRLRIEVADPQYKGLKKLKLRGKELKLIPPPIFKMMELEVLDMSPERESCLNFRLPLVPPSIGKLINLKVLMLDTNELQSIPKEVSLLHSLERLSLSNNNLKSLPRGFGRLSNLRSLHMANNQFETFPLEICDIKTLEFLDMSCNLLMALTEDISILTQLKTLLLNYNRLIMLPDSICELVDLECLWLGNNRLRQLPRDFSKLIHLDWGYRYTSSVLEKNPLVHPPIEICRMGPLKIEEYFKDLEAIRETSTPSFERDEFNMKTESSNVTDVYENANGIEEDDAETHPTNQAESRQGNEDAVSHEDSTSERNMEDL